MKCTMTLSTVLAFAVIKAAGLGINCRGSSWCVAYSGPAVADSLNGYIQSADSNRWYNNGEHIACTTRNVADGLDENSSSVITFCAFLQETGGEPGSNLKTLSQDILDHGCSACGSVPIFFPSSNDVSQGQLTFNFVANPGCDEGLC